MKLGPLFIEAGKMRVKRLGVWLPDGLHVWVGTRGVHVFWSGSPFRNQRRISFERLRGGQS